MKVRLLCSCRQYFGSISVGKYEMLILVKQIYNLASSPHRDLCAKFKKIFLKKGHTLCIGYFQTNEYYISINIYI